MTFNARGFIRPYPRIEEEVKHENHPDHHRHRPFLDDLHPPSVLPTLVLLGGSTPFKDGLRGVVLLQAPLKIEGGFMVFLVIFGAIVGLGFVAWFLINSYVQERK